MRGLHTQRSLARGFALAGHGLCHVIQADAQVVDPLLVRLAVGQAGLELFVVDHAALFQVNQEHLAGLQAPLAHDLALRHRQHAGLGTHDDHVVIGDAVARGAQAVAVKCGANLATIGEHDGSGAVPRLHHGSVVFVKRLATLVHHGVLFPRLGDHHHDSLGHGVAGHGQQLKAVVERGGVGLVREAQRIQLAQVVAQHRRGHDAFAGAHPVVVATHGVDFAVVRHVAIGVGQRPLGEGVGGEALVHQAQRRRAAGVLQVKVIGAHLVGQQQALVDDGAAAHARHVVLFAVLQAQLGDGLAGLLADDVQLAFQRFLHDHVVATTDEHLADDRFLGPHAG